MHADKRDKVCQSKLTLGTYGIEQLLNREQMGKKCWTQLY